MPDWTKKALFKGGFGQVDPNFLELPKEHIQPDKKIWL